MDGKTKELIAIGASVSAHCFPCLDYRLEEASKLGISSREIHQAVKAGIMVMNGASQKMVERIKALLPEIAARGNESCCDK